MPIYATEGAKETVLKAIIVQAKIRERQRAEASTQRIVSTFDISLATGNPLQDATDHEGLVERIPLPKAR